MFMIIIVTVIFKTFSSQFSVAATDHKTSGDIEGAKSLGRSSLIVSSIGVVLGIGAYIFLGIYLSNVYDNYNP